MDLLASTSLLLLLALIGGSAGKTIPTVDAVLGGNVTLTTAAPVPPDAVLIWAYSDGENVPVIVITLNGGAEKAQARYAGRASLNRTTGSLTMTSLRSADSGRYTLTVLVDGVATGDEVKLQVLDPVSDVVITSNLLEPVEYNSTVVLNCSAKGSQLRFDWFNGSDPLVLDADRMMLTKEKGSSILSIRSVLRTDLAGSIFCEASNSLQQTRSGAFTLTVFYGPDSITLSPQTVPQFISSSATFNLSCWAASSPPATFSWYHNQLPLGNVGSMLTLQALKDQGVGTTPDNYTCVASNAKTQRQVSSTTVTLALMDPISGAQISGLNTTLVAGNGTANLSCQAALGSVKTRAWMKDGKALSGPRLTFSDDKSWLLISPVLKEDNGEYHCHLSNAVSFSRASYTMVVYFGPEQIKVSGVNKAEENHLVTLTCSTASVPPASFTWKHNGSVITDTTETFTIPKPELKHSGTYTCEAYNPVTGRTITVTHHLQVKAEGTLDSGLSDGAIAGIVVAILVAIGAAVTLTIYCRQKIPIESPY